jgi:outer membrane protein assembly factor BamB
MKSMKSSRLLGLTSLSLFSVLFVCSMMLQGSATALASSHPLPNFSHLPVGPITHVKPVQPQVHPNKGKGGAIKWQSSKLNCGFQNSSPQLSGSLIYVIDYCGDVYALNSSDGSVAWDTNVGCGAYTTATVVNGVVYDVTYCGQVYALDASTGNTLWSTSLNCGEYYTQPTIANGVLYVGDYCGYFYAIDASSGSQIWSNDVGCAYYAPATVANSTVYIGSECSGVYAFDASSGNELWESSTNCGFEGAAPVLDGNSLYIGDYCSNVYAINANNGNQQWMRSFSSGIYQSVTIANGTVYTDLNNGVVLGLKESNGATVWGHYTGCCYEFSSPAVKSGKKGATIYVAAYNAPGIFALNGSNGTVVWNTATGTDFFSSVTLSGKTLYAADSQGYVYALSS